MSHRLASAHTESGGQAVKRQCIRKGTFSCWECKRRKTKCEFKPDTGNACLSCQRRGKPCIGQEYAENLESHDAGLEERVNRVESSVNQIIQQRTSQPARHSEQIATTTRNGANSPNRSGTSQPLRPPSPNLREIPSESHSLKIHLLAALPHPPKAAQIFTRGNFFSLPIHIRWQPTSTGTAAATGSEKIAQVSELPPATAHPIHFARKLIQLALCLHQLDLPDHDTARHYMNIAIRDVCSQESLMESVDGIETLMLESCYHINVGNIRHAWLAVRRAIAIAQLIGLPLQAYSIGSREENVWFRLVLADRCISWMLGLPSGVTDDSVVAKDMLSTETWTTRLQRCHVVVCGRIIARNLGMQRRRRRLTDSEENDEVDDFQATQDIDRELKEGAQCLPTDWWLRPRLRGTTYPETLQTTGKLIAQMHHHFLLIILYQPYVVSQLGSSLLPTNPMWDCTIFDKRLSQDIAYAACRHVLEGFLVLRGLHRTLSYRGVDDKVFVAVMMLLLIHIQGHAHKIISSLEHQRPYDLGLIGETMSILEETSLANGDTLTASAAKVLRKLMKIEARSADGARHNVWMEEALIGKTGYEFHESDDRLCLPVPYFGYVCVTVTESESPRLAVYTGSGVAAASDATAIVPAMQSYSETDVAGREPNPILTPSAVDFDPLQPIGLADFDDFDNLLNSPPR